MKGVSVWLVSLSGSALPVRELLETNIAAAVHEFGPPDLIQACLSLY